MATPTKPDDLTIPGTSGDSSDLDAAERGNQEIISQLKKDFEKRNALHKEVEDAVFYENDIYVPSDYEASTIKVHNPLPSHIVNTVVAALTKNGPKVQFPPIKGGDTGQRNAELRAAFFEASARRQEEDSENRWFRMFLSALVMKGEGVLKTLEAKKLAWSDYNAYTRRLAARLDDPDDEEYRDVVWRSSGGGRGKREQDDGERKRLFLAKTEEYKRGAPYPVTTTDVLPETFLYQKTAEGFSFLAEVKEVPYLDTLARFGAGLSSSGQVVAKEAMGLGRSEWQRSMDGVRTLTMYETWTVDRCHYWLAGPGQEASSGGTAKRGTLVKTVRHRYGDRVRRTLRGPYFHALGITTHNRLPHRAGLGILYGFLDLFKLLDSLLTIQSNSAFNTGFPAYRQKQGGGLILPNQSGAFGDDNASGTSRAPTTRVIPGRVLPWDVEPINQPTGSLVLDKVMADVRAFIELALPSVVQGIIDDNSGYAVNQAAHLARLAWDPIISNAQFALSRRVGFESWLIEKCLQEPVYVWGDQPATRTGGRRQAQAGWLSVGPDDLKGVHRYTVTLSPDTPSDQVIKGRTHEQLLKLRIETRDDAILDTGGQPEEVERWWLLEDFKNDPEIRAMPMERAKAKLRIRQQKALMGKPGQQDMTLPEGAPVDGGGPQVIQPGQEGQPLTPTPAGSVGGAGPSAPLPMSPAMPARHVSLE